MTLAAILNARLIYYLFIYLKLQYMPIRNNYEALIFS